MILNALASAVMTSRNFRKALKELNWQIIGKPKIKASKEEHKCSNGSTMSRLL
jgi:hypothetical protein